VNLWRLERLRLVRTHRVWILLAVFGVFGAIGPWSARYLPGIVERLGAGADVAVPPASPELAMSQFASNVAQIGLLAVVFVAAAALALDAGREMAVFLRTRASIRAILIPRYVITTIASLGALLSGTVIAYGGSCLLIGQPDAPGTVVGGVLLGLYFVFAVALTGLVSSLVRGVPATALLSLGVLIFLGLGSLVPGVGDWLPSALVGGFDAMVGGAAFTFWPAVVTTLALTAASVAGGVALAGRREI
jgi:ABC-2 type transport system permease protein